MPPEKTENSHKPNVLDQGRLLGVVAFSGRALAQAAARLGFYACTVDAFADFDCQNCGITRQVDWSDNQDILAGLHEILPCGSTVVLGGGTENRPDLLERLRGSYRVLGPTPEQLRHLRSLDFLRAAAAHAGIQVPEVRESCVQVSGSSDDWLLKPRSGAGGLNVRRWTADELLDSHATSGDYWQRRINGRVLGLYCIANGSPGKSSHFLAACESFTSRDWFGPKEFVYRGSWGPLPVAKQIEAAARSITDFVTREIAYTGWLQFDAIEASDGELYLLEFNPRWTSGMECLSLSNFCLPLSEHLAACGLSVPRSPGVHQLSNPYCLSAKAIYYCERDVHLTAELVTQLRKMASLADLPSDNLIGAVVDSGHPLVTLLAKEPRNTTHENARANLLRQLERARTLVDNAIQQNHLE